MTCSPRATTQTYLQVSGAARGVTRSVQGKALCPQGGEVIWMDGGGRPGWGFSKEGESGQRIRI